MAFEVSVETLEIPDGFCTIQCGASTGPLKSIEVEHLDPDKNDGAGVRVALIAQQGNANDLDAMATVMFCLRWDDIDSFVHMLQAAR
jgi:hypothetical protein